MNRIAEKLQSIKNSLLSFTSGGKDESSDYSPYLQLIKPFMDISKRANVQNFSRMKADRLMFEVKCSGMKLDTGIHNSSDDVELEMLRESSYAFYKSIFLRNQVHNLTDLSVFKEKAILALKKLKYKITIIDDELLLATKGKNTAVVQLGIHSTFKELQDTSWNAERVELLEKAKQNHNASAAIYLTPGSTSKQFRQIEKQSDVFVLTGWDIVQLFAETKITPLSYSA
ncbi:hypothetical protein ATS72_011860 [Pseudoalteromonas sp. 13-15]|uniref:hypothetical protein n=1 Tax=Pseudoalteromonas TaxID=53246 RepID=UPI00072FEA2B|nr:MULTISPECIES: hypothetical protein [Pseudoalteromonas]AUL74243.1 hypothetical protein ATS72_011860 [Pseudoalteromonas sp. 13-15]WFO19205.1 hypothetical protein ATS73_014845 [Pseudoalteromonas sp. H100]SIO00228.1 hypothetical protein SAMN05878071_2378 [Pseudoalteromonas marina]